jgi:uncharacterized protein (TIGR02687 family)
MAELNLKQITDKLNDELSGETRKLIFWYDDNAEFIEDIDALELNNAQVYHLEKDNQFYTKYYFERVDRQNHYLIYAPFPKPNVRENHLEDMLLYSKQFFADRASLLMIDLGIDPKYKPVIQKHIKFFGAKDRTQKFYDLELDNYTQENIEVALMSVLCKTKIASFDEVVRVVLTELDFDENEYLMEFDKYGLLQAFWRLCSEQFGYDDESPTLEKMAITMFVTYTQRSLHAEIPFAWKNFVSFKVGNIMAFLDNLMNNVLYRDRYNKLSDRVAGILQVEKVFESFSPDSLVECDTFEVFDHILIGWAVERLLNEDLGAKLAEKSISELCQYRRRKHYGEHFRPAYHLIESAVHIIGAANYRAPEGLENILKQYATDDYKIDQQYRKFYFNYDQLQVNSAFEKLRDLVENIYSNKFLMKSTNSWNTALQAEDIPSLTMWQRNFFNTYVSHSKDRVVVIISDALRYEVGQSLYFKLDNDEKCTAKLDSMISMLPSETSLGMAALLPHRSLEYVSDVETLVDDKPARDLKQREAILQSYVPQSRCVQFSEVKGKSKQVLRDIFTGMDVVYIYHNEIDAIGETWTSRNEVFDACSKAIDDIFDLIKRISVNANTHHFIVTADHGFIYKRDKLEESDKIIHTSDKNDSVKRRFIVSDAALEGDGITSYPMNIFLKNKDSRWVTVPTSSLIFKASGGVQNYVHGGSSLQEMLIPVIDVKVEKGKAETKPAEIALVSMVHKITNLIFSMDFIQPEPVSDVVKETHYKVFFISEDGERISNEIIHRADKRDSDASKRIFRLKFNFKNQQYDRSKLYYLVAYDEKNEIEVLRHGVMMDIAFADDFGFLE